MCSLSINKILVTKLMTVKFSQNLNSLQKTSSFLQTYLWFFPTLTKTNLLKIHLLIELVPTANFCNMFCSLHLKLDWFPTRREQIRFQEKVISAKYFTKKWNDFLIKTTERLPKQNMDVMLSFLCYCPTREMINCKQVPLKVFEKCFASQK